MGSGNRQRSNFVRPRRLLAGALVVTALLGALAPVAEAAPQGGATPRAAATTLYKAWRRHDRAAARRVADATSVSKLFARSANGPAWTFVECVDVEEPDPHDECSYRYRGGRAVIDVADSDAYGWLVSGITFTTA